jgi:hypothetical protein
MDITPDYESGILGSNPSKGVSNYEGEDDKKILQKVVDK